MGADREDESWKEICGCRQSQGLYLRCGRDGDQEGPEDSGGLESGQQEVVSPPLQSQHSVRLDISRGD